MIAFWIVRAHWFFAGMRAGPIKYHGIWQTLTLVVKEEGFFALWKGNGANCVRIVPNYACKVSLFAMAWTHHRAGVHPGVQFTFNDYFKDLVRKPGTPLDFHQMMVSCLLQCSAARVAFCSSLMVNACALLPARRHCCGHGAGNSQSTSALAIKVVLIDVRAVCWAWPGRAHLSARACAHAVVAGFGVQQSSSVQGYCTLRLVRVRWRAWAQSISHVAGIVDCFKRTVRAEGWPGLYKGIGPTMASGAPYTVTQERATTSGELPVVLFPRACKCPATTSSSATFRVMRRVTRARCPR
jgi:hypothetical protein